MAAAFGTYTVSNMVAPEVADDVKKGFRSRIVRLSRKARGHESAR